MSRFFKGGNESDSESEEYYSTSDESDSNASSQQDFSGSDDNESEDSAPEASDAEDKASKPVPRYLKQNYDDSDSDDDEKRVVKSAKDKQLDELRQTISSMENAVKINDWANIQTEFEKLNKLVQKHSSQFNTGTTPVFYIRALVQLDDALQSAAEANAKKKMNATNSKAFNVMKQKIRKNNKEYEDEIAEFRQDPTVVDELKEAEDSEEADTTSETSSSEDDQPRTGINRWLKKDVSDKPEKAKKPIHHAAKTKKPTEKKSQEEEGSEGAFSTVGKGGKKLIFSAENIYKHLAEIIEARGKKGTDKQELFNNLRLLLKIATNPIHTLKITIGIISAYFDSTSQGGYMPIEVWKNVISEINNVFSLLEANKRIILAQDVEEKEEIEDYDIDWKEGKDIHLKGDVISFLERCDEELNKSLQHLDAHSTEYIDRLKDEVSLYTLFIRIKCYYEKIKVAEAITRIQAMRMEHLYYKPDNVITALHNIVSKKLPHAHFEKNNSHLIHDICVYLYENGSGRVRTRSMLGHVYHHALHNRYTEARDLLLMSHLQESIGMADIATQILYNRVLAQLGLCAFRCGLIKEAHNALNELCSSGKTKELMAQGFQSLRHGEKSQEQEKLEKQRQLPFHMHINLELLECVYLTSSMLLEIPYMASSIHDFGKKKVISKPFRRMLEFNEKQVFCGPPENTRDHIMAAAKALSVGDWKKTIGYINAIKVWDYMPGGVKASDIKAMLATHIQREALRTYIFTYSSYYSSISIKSVSNMFQIPEKSVYSLMSKMIWNEEVHALIDQVEGVLVVHQQELTKVQYLSGQFAEKCSSLVDTNEKLLEVRSGGGGGFGGFTGKSYAGNRKQGGNNNTGGGNHHRPPKENQAQFHH